MKTKIILLAYLLCVLQFKVCATGKQNLDESIIRYFQKSDGLSTTTFPAFAFCIPEVSFILQEDSIFLEFWAKKSEHINYLKNNSNDFYLTKLLQVKFLKDSLSVYYANNEDSVISQFIDILNTVPEYELQQQDMPLFFKSFTDESGVGAEKIETLLITQDLNIIFDYIENNEQARKRFLEWIDEEIEVWCPAVGSNNEELNDRLAWFLYNRLKQEENILAQQAALKMKEWFGW